MTMLKLKDVYSAIISEYEPPKLPKRSSKVQKKYEDVPGYFLIDRYGKIYKPDGVHHGTVVFQIPELHEKAKEMFGDDEGIEKAAAKGDSQLYSILYEYGLARCGINNFAFITAPPDFRNDGWWKFYEICKEKDFQHASVELINNDNYTTKSYDNSINMDTFFTKYLNERKKSKNKI